MDTQYKVNMDTLCINT